MVLYASSPTTPDGVSVPPNPKGTHAPFDGGIVGPQTVSYLPDIQVDVVAPPVADVGEAATLLPECHRVSVRPRNIVRRVRVEIVVDMHPIHIVAAGLRP